MAQTEVSDAATRVPAVDMAKAAFTPGPWRYEQCAPREVSLKRSHWQVGQIHAPALGVAIVFGGVSLNEANARLIAAAPTMHEYIAQRAALGDVAAAQILESIDGTR